MSSLTVVRGRETHQEAGVGHAGRGDALVVRGVRGGGGHHGGSLGVDKLGGGSVSVKIKGGEKSHATPVDMQTHPRGGFLHDDVGDAFGDRATVRSHATYPEERLLEERAALGGGGIFGKSGFDLHLVPGAKLARGGNHGVAELALSVGARGAEHGGDAGLRAGARDDTRR